METSDSEYFESADEDFDSDLEDQKKQSPTPSHQVIEPELCKLKIAETEQVNTQNDEEPVAQTIIRTLSVIEPKAQCVERTEAGANVKANGVNSDKTADNSTVHQNPSSNALECAANQDESKETSNSVGLKVTANPIPDSSQPETCEENLWDDDELDWGSETAKEQTDQADESKQSTPESKTLDSGWDDFDVDWEPSSAANEPNTCSRNREDDDWEPLEAPKDTDTSWSLFGRWGISSMINTATTSVSTITNNLSTALEGSIGIPAAEDLAKANSIATSNELVSEPSAAFGFSNLVSGVTKFVESTGTKVITGGLDTLEAIGKKTVEVLQDGDPGLKKKRAFLKLNTMGKPNLSQILREAKEQAEEEMADVSLKDKRRNKNYETLFDDHHGLVHLEALEMLSKLCSIKLVNLNNSLSGSVLKDMQETLEQVKELCELPEDEEDDKMSIKEVQETISSAIREINIPLSYEKLLTVYEEADAWIQSSKGDAADVHQKAIDTLAQLTALAVEQYHKAGELLLVKEHRSTADEADSLVQITMTVKSLIRNEAEKFTDHLNSMGDCSKDEINDHITNIFYEAGNSGTYIQDAFQLLISVLQVGAV